MNAPKMTDLEYIEFLVATPNIASATEAARVQPLSKHRAAHDAITRFLHRITPDSTPLWHEAEQHVDRTTGLLVIDDTTLDKPYAHRIELVHRHWSGKQHRVVSGINLVTLLWSDGTAAIPCDYRLFDKPTDGLTKNDHFLAMVATAKQRGFQPRYVAFDSWYSGLTNLKAIRAFGWHWITRLKHNRHVDPDGTGNRPVSAVPMDAWGTAVHLKGYGMIQVFRLDTPDGDTDYWATSDLGMGKTHRETVAGDVWSIETYHRGLKQHCAVERSAVRSARAQRNHIGCAIRAFLRLEHHRIRTGTSWFEAKMSIIRPAIQAYLATSSPISKGLVQSRATA